jgi:uncharacterized membrane protein (UPF0136 family)
MKRWSPYPVAALSAVGVFVVLMVLGGIYAYAVGLSDAESEALGERTGPGVLVLTVLGGVIGYYVQRSRRADKK